MSSVEPSIDIRRSGVKQSAATGADLNWPLHLAFIAGACVFFALYAPAFISLAHTWATTGTFEYAFLIFPICAVLAWTRRDAVRHATGAPRPRALALAAGLGFIWLLGALADINLAQHFAVVVLCPVLVYVFYGPAVARVLAFPLGYVLFAIPFGNFMVGPLQDITAQLSVWALHLTDVPVFKSGRIIQTPAAAWHVAEACSGVKFFIATTAFGVLYANIFFTSLSRRLVFIACAMVVPIIANGLRVFFTILIGEHFGVQYASGTDHVIFGWQFFGTVLVLLFFAGWPFHQPPQDLWGVAQSASAAPGVTAPTRSRTIVVTLIALCVFALGPAWFWSARAVASTQGLAPASAWPQALAGHGRVAGVAAMPDPGLRFADATRHETAFYRTPSGPVRIDRIVDQAPRGQGHELVTSANHVFDPKQWEVERATRVAPQSGAPGFNQLMLSARQGDSRVRLQYVFRVRSHWASSAFAVKLWQAAYGLAARPASTSMVVVSEPVVDDADHAAFADIARAATAFVAGGVGARQ